MATRIISNPLSALHSVGQRLVLVLMLACASGSAGASKTDFPEWPWVHAGRYQQAKSNGVTMWINMNSMKRSGYNRLRVWIKYANDQVDQHGVAETLAYEKVDCAQDMHTTYSLIEYAADGRVLRSSKGTDADEEPIIPDTLLMGMMPFICAAGGIKH